MTMINYEWTFLQEILSSVADSIEVDVGRTWDFLYSVLTQYIVDVYVKDLGILL